MFDQYYLEKEKFDKKFLKHFSDDSFGEILNYSIEEGKRLRPILLLETLKLFGIESDDVSLKFAIALELIHNYSLIHDDLPSMDNDDYRRGRETTHKKFGEDMAILAGDSLLNEACSLVIEAISNRLTTNVVEAANYLFNSSGHLGMIGGQYIDIQDNVKSLEDIELMYLNKTCKLLMCATKIAAILAEQDEEVVSEFEELGYCIGMAFQIQDDFLDYERDLEIHKVTFITLKGKEASKQAIISYSKRAIDIVSKYENSEFLVTLINKLISRNI